MNWKIFCLSISVVCAVGFILHALSGLSVWVCLVLAIAGMALNGYIATIEDDWPGGFNNPEPADSKTQKKIAKAMETILLRLFRRRS